MARSFSKSFYNSKEWEKVRQTAMLRDHYLCQLCGDPAEEVHHIIHLTPENIGDVSITLNLKNLKCLCRDCHFKQHEQDKLAGRKIKTETNEGYHFDANGQLVPDSPL